MRKTHTHECNFSQMTLCTHPPHLCSYFIIQPVCESTPLTLISAAEYGWEVTVTTKKTLDSNYDGAYLDGNKPFLKLRTPETAVWA